VVVGEEQHYGRAARRLRVAQPALSRQIQDLEDEIGCQLFDRLPRGVKISAAGKSFLEDARRVLQQVNEATMRAPSAWRSASPGHFGRVHGERILAWCGSRLIPAISANGNRTRNSN